MEFRKTAVCKRCGYKWKPKVIKPFVACPSCRTSVRMFKGEYVSPLETKYRELRAEFDELKKQVEDLMQEINNERKGT
jgi:hypothetical protein